MINLQLQYYPLKTVECDIGLLYYNYLEQAYVTNTGKWLDDNM